jgi:hypothetical protein
MSNHSRLHKPTYVGPGIWFTMHTLAAMAKTPDEKKQAIGQIKYLQSKFPCEECKLHFGNYIETHPLENTLNGNEDSLFLWTFNFHNVVNFRLGKSQVSYEEAKNIFLNEMIFCSADCESDVPEVVEKSKSGTKIIPRDMPGYMF